MDALSASFLGHLRSSRMFAVVLSAIARRQIAHLALTSMSLGNPELSVQVTSSLPPRKNPDRAD